MDIDKGMDGRADKFENDTISTYLEVRRCFCLKFSNKINKCL